VFTDSFTRSAENLSVSSNWTLVDGLATAAQVDTSNRVKFGSGTGSHQCPDQGSSAHYTQVERIATTVNRAYFECCVRLTDSNNFIGARYEASKWELYKRDTGSFTLLGSDAVTGASNPDTLYLEVDSGNNYVVKVNGSTSISGVSDSFNSTETRQGLVTRNDTASPAIDDFEADALSGVATITADGVLVAGSATLSGVTEVVNTASGVLVAGAATIAGQATVGSVATITADGVLVAGDATLSGQAAVVKVASGALVAGEASMSGAVSLTRKANGALVAGGARITGGSALAAANDEPFIGKPQRQLESKVYH